MIRRSPEIAAEANGPTPREEVQGPKRVAERPRLNKFIWTAVVICILAAALVAPPAWRLGSFAAAIEYIRGSSIYTSPRIGVPGDGSEGHTVSFVNLSKTPIRILGYQPSCPCVAVSGLPLELGPRQTKRADIRAASVVSKDVSVIFFTDAPGESRISTVVSVIPGKS